MLSMRHKALVVAHTNLLPMSMHNMPVVLTVFKHVFLQYYLDNDPKLKKFVPIIHDSVVYPVILDANRTVCSMPPIINGAHSAVIS